MELMRRRRGSLPDLLRGWPFTGGVDWPSRAWSRMPDAFDDDMNVEEFTDHGEIVVRAEMPGVDPDKDIEISLADGRLYIRAERRQEKNVDERNYRRSEIRYGSFARVVPLPTTAKEEDIKATYKDGVLEVRAPFDEATSKKSRIPITRGATEVQGREVKHSTDRPVPEA